MKRVGLLAFTLIALSLGACNKSDNNNNQPAVVPQQTCGNGIPNTYGCTPYNATGYNYPYGTNGYSNGGYNIPYYSYGYGCPSGFQPFYTGGVPGWSGWSNSGYNCMHSSFFYSGYSSYGYQPYYNPSFNWGGGYTGVGPAQACDTYIAGTCGNVPGVTCMPVNGYRYGYCVRTQ